MAARLTVNLLIRIKPRHGGLIPLVGIPVSRFFFLCYLGFPCFWPLLLFRLLLSLADPLQTLFDQIDALFQIFELGTLLCIPQCRFSRPHAHGGRTLRVRHDLQQSCHGGATNCLNPSGSSARQTSRNSSYFKLPEVFHEYLQCHNTLLIIDSSYGLMLRVEHSADDFAL